MINMQQIEELMKTVNRSAIKAMLRNAAILGDEKATDEMKAQALENVKAIAGNKQPKKSKKVKAPEAAAAPMMAAVQQPAAPAAPEQPQIQYPEGLHLSPLNTGGHDEAAMRGIFDSLPHEEKQHVADWHASTKVQKSIETLFSLFTQLKKHL